MPIARVLATTSAVAQATRQIRFPCYDGLATLHLERITQTSLAAGGEWSEPLNVIEANHELH